jgi:alkane 1-monooxygenase
MAKQYLGLDKNGNEICYVDQKRWLYLLSLFFPMVPALSAALFFSPIGVWATLFPAFFMFGLVPLLDAIIGEDPHNPPDAIVGSLSADMHYKFMVRTAVVIVWISFLATVVLVGTQDLPIWSWLVLAFGTGTISGSGLAFGHELGHKQDPVDRIFALFNNAVVGYAHIRYEHNVGHHIWVSTPEDPASARMGESIFRFAMREIPGALKSGFTNERLRLHRRGKSFWSFENEILQSFSITGSAALLLTIALGWQVLPFILVHNFFGWYLLSQANYVEHYGLLRQKKANGQYEPCRPHHSWNTNHIFSNLMTFHLQRHSDHHTYPLRPYQALRNYPDLPSLPQGYPGMFILANVPPLFFRAMDPRVIAWSQQDLSKVNIAPYARKRLERRWGVQD